MTPRILVKENRLKLKVIILFYFYRCILLWRESWSIYHLKSWWNCTQTRHSQRYFYMTIFSSSIMRLINYNLTSSFISGFYDIHNFYFHFYFYFYFCFLNNFISVLKKFPTFSALQSYGRKPQLQLSSNSQNDVWQGDNYFLLNFLIFWVFFSRWIWELTFWFWNFLQNFMLNFDVSCNLLFVFIWQIFLCYFIFYCVYYDDISMNKLNH